MSTPVGLARFKRTITSKFNGICHFCAQATIGGRDFAAVNNTGKWIPVCTTCAQSVTAQVAGIVANCETLAAGVEVDMNDVLMPTEENLLATLQGTADRALALDTLVAMVSVRQQIIQQVYTLRVTPAEVPADDVTVGLYVLASGGIYKIYMTQNDRLASKMLRVTPTGRFTDEGVEVTKGSFQYVKGGVRVVREALVAGKCHRMTAAEASAFGTLHSWCVNCAKDLDDDRSLAVHYGATCAGNLGWYYPTWAEAANILGRPVTMPTGKVINPS